MPVDCEFKMRKPVDGQQYLKHKMHALTLKLPPSFTPRFLGQSFRSPTHPSHSHIHANTSCIYPYLY